MTESRIPFKDVIYNLLDEYLATPTVNCRRRIARCIFDMYKEEDCSFADTMRIIKSKMDEDTRKYNLPISQLAYIVHTIFEQEQLDIVGEGIDNSRLDRLRKIKFGAIKLRKIVPSFYDKDRVDIVAEAISIALIDSEHINVGEQHDYVDIDISVTVEQIDKRTKEVTVNDDTIDDIELKFCLEQIN